MTLVLLKVTLTPLLIAAATLAAQRWGAVVGGWLLGLPLTSGPISVFLALQHAPSFVAHAARGTLLGMLSVAAYCVAYGRSAAGSAWLRSTALGLGVYGVVTWAASLFTSSLAVSAMLVLFLLRIAEVTLGAPPRAGREQPPRRRELFARMAAATGMVLVITAAADSLGPTWSGLLTPFPVFAGAMAIFAHRENGAASARSFLRGVLVGLYAMVAFFAVVGLLVGHVSLIVTYTLAAGGALAMNGISLMQLLREGSPMPLAVAPVSGTGDALVPLSTPPYHQRTHDVGHACAEP